MMRVEFKKRNSGKPVNFTWMSGEAQLALVSGLISRKSWSGSLWSRFYLLKGSSTRANSRIWTISRLLIEWDVQPKWKNRVIVFLASDEVDNCCTSIYHSSQKEKGSHLGYWQNLRTSPFSAMRRARVIPQTMTPSVSMVALSLHWPT